MIFVYNNLKTPGEKMSTQLVHHQFIENFPYKNATPIKLDKVIRVRQD